MDIAEMAVGSEAPPTDKEVAAARAAIRELSRYDSSAKMMISVEGVPTAIEIPSSLFANVIQLLAQMANGNAVTVVPVLAELTTNQAAEILNVSRPFLISLLDKKEIPYRRVGTHRKLLGKDVMNYKSKTEARRTELLDQMVQENQSLGLYDDDYPLNKAA